MFCSIIALNIKNISIFLRFFIMPGDDDIFAGKIYLVKIKREEEFTSEDFLWALCNVGKDNVDLEDFKNIVQKLNGLGLWNPCISMKPVKWKSLKNIVACKVLSVVGNPTLLLEEVNTFKQVLELAYGMGILTNIQGREILDGKNEEQLGFSSGSTASQSRTLLDVLSGSSTRTNAIKDMQEKSRDIISDQNNTKSGKVKFPAPVPALPVCGQGPSILSDKEQSVVEQFDFSSLESAGNAAPPGIPDEGSVEANDVVTTNSHAGGSAGGVNGAFDPSKFNLDAIDNELAQLEASTGSDGAGMARQLARYKTITKNLRESLVFSCMTVQKYMRLVDARDMQLRDSSSYSANDVLTGLKPTLAKMEKVMESCLARDIKFSADIGAVQSKLDDVRGAIESNATLATQESVNLVRHLGTFGMVDTGSTFDMPSAISAIYRTLNDDIAPAFKAGNVTTYVASQTPANPVEAFLMPSGNVAAGHPLPGHKRAADGSGGAMAALHANQGPYWQSQSVPPPNIGQDSLCGLPPQYRDVSVNYLGVQQTPPQHIPPQPQHYSVPPPPFKQMRYDGASVVRSVFQNYQQANSDVGSAPASAGPRNLFHGPPPAPTTQNGPGSVASSTQNGPGSVASEITELN